VGDGDVEGEGVVGECGVGDGDAFGALVGAVEGGFEGVTGDVDDEVECAGGGVDAALPVADDGGLRLHHEGGWGCDEEGEE
jgi:hypothetical protein